METHYLFAAMAFVFGLAFGSFLNVCIYRLPRGLSVVAPRSACPSCNTPIPAYDNIPVLSWMLLGGRCRSCKTRITARYAIVELLTGLLFFAVFVRFDPTAYPVAYALKYCIFSFLLLGLIFTDAETHLLPDKMTLPGFIIGALFSLIVPVHGIFSRFFPQALAFAPDLNSRLLSLADALIGAFVGAAFIYLTGALYMKIRGVEGMGFGDVKLMAMVGVFLGVKLTIFVLFGASLVGGLYGLFVLLTVFSKRLARYRQRPHGRQRAWDSASFALRHLELPFGVFLGGMSLVSLFFGDNLLNWYLGLFR